MPSLVHLDSDSDSESESLADSVTDILSAIASDDSDASYDPDFEFSPGAYVTPTGSASDGSKGGIIREYTVRVGPTMQANHLVNPESLSKITDAISLHLTRQMAYGRPTAESELMLGLVADIDVITQQMKNTLLAYEQKFERVFKKMHSHDRQLRECMALFDGKWSDIFDPNWESFQFAIKNYIGEIKLIVLSTFSRLLPGVFQSDELVKLYSRLINGIGWSKFLVRVNRYHRAHFVILPNGESSSGEQPQDSGGVEPSADGILLHKKSVFDNFHNCFESTYLTSGTRRGDVLLSENPIPFTGSFCNHFADLDAPVQHGASVRKLRQSGNSKIALRFFVPLLVWSYNQCKECLVLLDALIAQRQRQEESAPDSSTADPTPSLKVEIDYSTVFRYGSVVDFRRRLNATELSAVDDTVGTEAAARDTAKQSDKSSNDVHDVKAGEEVHLNDLRKERLTFLNKFNLIRKCLLILTNDTILNIVLNFDTTTLENFYPPSRGHFDTSSSPNDWFIKDEAENRLVMVALRLRESDADYDSNKKNLIATEHEIDEYVSTAVRNSAYCEDYAILVDLLEKLNPIRVVAVDGASDISVTGQADNA